MKKVMFIGQAMPRVKRDPHDWPSLNKWLYSIELTDETIRQYFFYSALVNYFPGAINGSHLVPSESQIRKDRSRPRKQMMGFNPEIVVTVGKLSLEKCLSRKVDLLTNVIGSKFEADPYELLGRTVLIIPLPHPSGASTWRHKRENQKLLGKALDCLKREVG